MYNPKSIGFDPSLIIDGRKIICPIEIKADFQKACKKLSKQEYIYQPYSFNIQFLPNLPQKWSGKWISKSNRFIEHEPTEWEIYFGFVEKEMLWEAYVMREPYIMNYLSPKYGFIKNDS